MARPIKNQEDWDAIKTQPRWSAGYQRYRNGQVFVHQQWVDPRSRITLAGTKKEKPLLSEGKRKSLIRKIYDAMKDWRFSPFEFEATARHWLRQTFCLQGYPWARSDAEALHIVAEALKGFPRPSWEQGQQNYTVGDDFCRGCGGPLEEADIARRARYCCDDCKKTHYYRTNRHATGEVRILGPVKCKNPTCPETFFPRRTGHELCSHACRIEYARLTIPKRVCDFEECDEVFQPTHEKQLYCGPRCRGKARGQKNREATAAGRQKRKCEWCNEPFTPGKWNARFCSEKHRKAAERARAKEREAPDHPIHKLFDDAA